MPSLLSCPAELLLFIGLKHLPTLCALRACSMGLRRGLQRELESCRAGVQVRREEITVGSAELLALASKLHFIELISPTGAVETRLGQLQVSHQASCPMPIL